ncbi:NAD(P)-binding domain-containing protein [Saccharopolyspora sp. K220]|uniref:ketopantoate reductase family protein n=1 Tax=Saccharopolyspora soli TaxID=2926618 RepID=UPI001F58E877|nr:2-dehydropantoate 2-reductase N-terminal domain-containing protein [Saccharopolyspora soli]MCI2420801.1 NAD(P)-binding domain-containing protein [Saccharopolyspora soli]
MTGRYTVIGGGAIGGTLAFDLVRAGHDVSIVDTDAGHVEAIRHHGLRLERDGSRTAAEVPACTPEEFTGTLDRVLLAVKAQATPVAAKWIAERLSSDACVVSVQNGFNEPEIARHIGWPRTVAAFVNLFADVVEPGLVRDGGAGALVVGEPNGAAVSQRVRDLVHDLQAWGPAQASDNVEGYLWAKAGFGAMLAATALADAPMADLIERHSMAMHALTEEVFDVATALGIGLEAFDAFEPTAFVRGASPARRQAATARLVAWLRTQPKDRSGIWRDLAVRRRPVEVTTHYRSVLERADLPLLRAVLDGLRELERDPGGMSEARLDELDRLAQEPKGAP